MAIYSITTHEKLQILMCIRIRKVIMNNDKKADVRLVKLCLTRRGHFFCY